MSQTNYSTGHEAERYAANYLKMHGYKVHQINWKTPRCEIDIVAEKQKTIFFVEVKYRKSDAQGTGIEYITPTKLRQMQYSAEVWVQENKWTGDYELAALEVSGDNFKITNFLDRIL